MKNTLLIIVTIVGVVSMGVTVGAYVWLLGKVQSTAADAALLVEEGTLLAAQNEQTQAVRRVVRATQQEREKLNSYFITDGGIVGFLESIEALGAFSSADVRIVSVEEGNPIDKDKLIKPLFVDVELSGSFSEVFHTLALIESFPRAMSVRTVRLTQVPKQLIWQATVGIQVLKITEESDA